MTFQKRQKEFKSQEKQRAKVERREQKKLAKRAAKEALQIKNLFPRKPPKRDETKWEEWNQG